MTAPTAHPQKIRIPQTKLWIGGNWREAASGRSFETMNPATEEVIATVAEAGADDIDRAVKSARKAFESGPWPKMKSREREKIMRRIADLIRVNTEELASLETLDSGKPLQNSLDIDLPAAAHFFDYFAGWTDKLTGETIPCDPDYFSYTLREPLGVIGAITPWNFPLLIAAQKIAPALASGNTVVLKPAEQTPLSALRLAEISAGAGLPEGVLNVVPGFGPVAGAALVEHSEVDGISFTGEYVTGQEIMKNASQTLKRISFELGGKSAHIIFADGNLDQAADFACDGIFFNQGEVCCAGSRLFVERKVKKDFRDCLLEKAKSWQPEDPFRRDAAMGAIVSREQYEKVLRYIDTGGKEGAQLLMDGRREKTKGFFIGPTIFANVSNRMRIAQEEIFGPVLCEIEFTDFDEAVGQANQSFYGLAGAVWTRDLAKAHRAARALRAGTVWVNTYGAADPAMPFGGYKMSGSGREGGIHTFDFYTQMKSVWMRI